MKHALTLAAALSLAACSGGASDQADAQADNLENAAKQSTPEAAEVLEQQADAIRDNGTAGAAGQPGSSVQQAVEKAGEAQATNAAGAAPAPAATPQSKQALPHGAEKGNPPPKTDTK
jgi:hypothetical protein